MSSKKRLFPIAILVLIVLAIIYVMTRNSDSWLHKTLLIYCQDQTVEQNDSWEYKFCKHILADELAQPTAQMPTNDEGNTNSSTTAIEQDKNVAQFGEPEITDDTQNPTMSKTVQVVAIKDKYLSGMINPSSDTNFKKLPSQYSNKESYVHYEVYPKLIQMINDAQKDGINLEVVSAFRSYQHQKGIWERKWNSFSGSDSEKFFKILRYSSWPGISRHHWGTDIDFNSVQFDYWNSATGKKTYQWLKQNAPKYGFCEPYSGTRNAGYENEPWHWSYKQVALPLQRKREQSISDIVNQPIHGANIAVNKEKELMSYVSSVSSSCL